MNLFDLTFRKAIAAILFFSLLAGCGGINDETAKKAVLDSLDDPGSVEFGRFSRVGDDYACLSFNAKGSSAEYSGDRQAYLRRNVDGWSVLVGSISDHDDCVENTKKLAALRLKTN